MLICLVNINLVVLWNDTALRIKDGTAEGETINMPALILLSHVSGYSPTPENSDHTPTLQARKLQVSVCNQKRDNK